MKIYIHSQFVSTVNDVSRAPVPQQSADAGRDPLRINSAEGEINQMGAAQQAAGHMISPGQEHTQTQAQDHMRSHHPEELRQQETRYHSCQERPLLLLHCSYSGLMLKLYPLGSLEQDLELWIKD